jgi:hypothetical protein
MSIVDIAKKYCRRVSLEILGCVYIIFDLIFRNYQTIGGYIEFLAVDYIFLKHAKIKLSNSNGFKSNKLSKY